MMSRYPVQQPVAVGERGVGMSYKGCTVLSVNTETRMALVRDAFGKIENVRCDIMHAKGNLPAQGEQWMLERKYGMWIFGAIVTGGTQGVVIPPDNVTGLNDTLTAADTRVTNVANDSLARDTTLGNRATTLETNTTTQAQAKGDILAAPAAGQLQRLPAGTTNLQTLVPDSSTATGLAWKTPLALPVALTGATAAGRFVGYTTSGAPTSGTFLAGDYVQARDGHVWICTAAGSPGTWTSKSSANETSISDTRSEVFGASTRTQAPYCAVRFTGSFTYATSQNDLFAQGGWTDIDQSESMRFNDGTYTYVQIPIAGRYRFQLHYQGTNGATGGRIACKITRNGITVTSNSIASGVNWAPPNSEITCDAVTDAFCNAGDKIYWSNWGDVPYTIAGTTYGSVRTKMTVYYLRSS
jgi:hypothetical protein